MIAEARDYRETLALEEKMKEDPDYREKWVERQSATLPQLIFSFSEEDEETRADDQAAALAGNTLG